MNQHVIDMIIHNGSVYSNLYIQGIITHNEYMKSVELYNDCLKQENDFIINHALGVHKYADYEPLHDGKLSNRNKLS